MKRSIWIWGLSAFFIVVIPVSVVLLFGDKPANSGERDLVVITGIPAPTSTGNPDKRALDNDNQVADISIDDEANDASIVLIEESTPLDIPDLSPGLVPSPLTVNALTIAQARPSGRDIDGIISQTLDQEFFGGTGTESTGSTSEPDQVAIGKSAAKDVVMEVKTDKSPSQSDSDLPADFPAELLVGAKEKKGTVKGVNDVKKKKKGNDRPRVEVVVLRPRNEFVKSHEDVIGRTKVNGHPIVLVRSRQVGSTWWVQEVMPRKGKYFRAVAQFGNKKTSDGTRFQYVVAFVEDEDDVPETGTNYQEIPPEFQVSEEFDAIVRKAE
jgi:hypothetical protein